MSVLYLYYFPNAHTYTHTHTPPYTHTHARTRHSQALFFMSDMKNGIHTLGYLKLCWMHSANTHTHTHTHTHAFTIILISHYGHFEPVYSEGGRFWRNQKIDRFGKIYNRINPSPFFQTP